jgi:Skp family chaperone for outer membrane proteins
MSLTQKQIEAFRGAHDKHWQLSEKAMDALFDQALEALELRAENERLQRERDEALHDRDEALDYAQTIVETYMKERDEALAREAEWMMRYKSTMIVDQRGYDRAIDEAAAVAEHYEPRCDICPSGVTNAIRSLKEKP